MRVEHPILTRIRQFEEDARTGFLHLEKEGQNIIICFRRGLMAAAGSTLAQLQLGKLLSKRGYIKPASIPKLLEMARRKRVSVGRAAVMCGFLDAEALNDVVREQIVQSVGHGISQDFEFRSFEDASIDLYEPAALPCEHLILELARIDRTPSEVDPKRLICLKNGLDFFHLPWYPQELSVLSQLKTPRTVQDLAAAAGIDPKRLSRILCVLDKLHLITQIEAPPCESMAIVKRDRFSTTYFTPEVNAQGVDDRLETLRSPSSFISEQFKFLKVRMAEAAKQASLRVVAVSSSAAREGKSLISVNLAISTSNDPGKRVVLVDCDLRNPSLHRFLGASIEPGLLGFLENGYLEPYCYMRRLDKLFFITAGGTCKNPVELLSEERMSELIDYLKSEFDCVILDCPPFGPMADAQILTGLADGVLMVMRRGATTYDRIEKAFMQLDRTKLVGLVLNDVKPMIFNTRYPYRSYQYDGEKAGTTYHRSRNYLD